MTKAISGFLSCLFAILIFQSCNSHPSAKQESGYYNDSDYYRVLKYDVHIHVNTDSPYFINHCLQDNFSLLDLNVNANDYPPIEEQKERAIRYIKQFRGRVAFATTISVDNWDDPTWAATTIAYLKKSFDEGAVAVKFWKNIGMTLRDKNGKFVMIDNPRFDSIFDFIEKSGKTAVGHLGEPKNCWLPLAEMTVRNDSLYYATYPQYHMFLHPEYPSYMDQINARDHMLKKHPGLHFSGAHLGSLEWSVDELARRLDSFPQMGVDMASRICHLQYQCLKNHQKVYDFFIKYQDRLMYATDLEADIKTDSTALIKTTHDTHMRDWHFFTSDQVMEAPEVRGLFKGLHLPRNVVDKIFRLNAEKWFAGFKGDEAGARSQINPDKSMAIYIFI